MQYFERDELILVYAVLIAILVLLLVLFWLLLAYILYPWYCHEFSCNDTGGEPDPLRQSGTHQLVSRYWQQVSSHGPGTGNKWIVPLQRISGFTVPEEYPVRAGYPGVSARYPVRQPVGDSPVYP